MSRFERNPNSADQSDHIDGDNPVVVDLATKRTAIEAESSRSKLKVLAQLGLAGAGVSVLILAVWANKNETFENPTGEQRNAERLLAELPEAYKVHNLVVGTDGVNLRDKPNTDGVTLGEAGDVEDFLKPGTVIDSAAVTPGNDDDIPWDRSRQDKWVFFENPKKEGEILFANSELFQPNPELELAPTVDLDK